MKQQTESLLAQSKQQQIASEQQLKSECTQLKSENTQLQQDLAHSKQQQSLLQAKLKEAQLTIQELTRQVQSYERAGQEVEVLRDMVRGSQTQLKSAHVDNQRLLIKIKRLELESSLGKQQSSHSSMLPPIAKPSPRVLSKL